MQAANHLFLMAASDFMWSLNTELMQFNHSADYAALMFEDQVRISTKPEHKNMIYVFNFKKLDDIFMVF